MENWECGRRRRKRPGWRRSGVWARRMLCCDNDEVAGEGEGEGEGEVEEEMWSARAHWWAAYAVEGGSLANILIYAYESTDSSVDWLHRYPISTHILSIQ